jgi:hypothetical protein
MTWRARAWNPSTSVLSPTSRCSASIQNVFTAPVRVASGVSTSQYVLKAALCGIVTLPARLFSRTVATAPASAVTVTSMAA